MFQTCCLIVKSKVFKNQRIGIGRSKTSAADVIINVKFLNFIILVSTVGLQISGRQISGPYTVYEQFHLGTDFLRYFDSFIRNSAFRLKMVGFYHIMLFTYI